MAEGTAPLGSSALPAESIHPYYYLGVYFLGSPIFANLYIAWEALCSKTRFPTDFGLFACDGRIFEARKAPRGSCAEVGGAH